MKVIAYINEIYSKTEIELSYKNEEENPIEIIVEIPLRVEIIFNYFTAKIKNKIIKSKVIESNKAEKKYNDAIASGNTGIASSYDSSKKICSLKIGNLPKGEILNLKFSFLQFTKIKDSYYYLNLIKDFPFISDVKTKEFEGKIIIETSSKIIDLITKNFSNENIDIIQKYSKKNKKCEIDYNKDSLEKILFQTVNMEKNL